MCKNFRFLLSVFLPAGEEALCTGQEVIGDADGLLAVLPILGKDGVGVAAAGEDANIFPAEGITAVLAHHLVPLLHEESLPGTVTHLAGIEGGAHRAVGILGRQNLHVEPIQQL